MTVLGAKAGCWSGGGAAQQAVAADLANRRAFQRLYAHSVSFLAKALPRNRQAAEPNR